MVIYMLPDSVFHLCSEESKAPKGPHPFQALLEAGGFHVFLSSSSEPLLQALTEPLPQTVRANSS